MSLKQHPSLKTVFWALASPAARSSKVMVWAMKRRTLRKTEESDDELSTAGQVKVHIFTRSKTGSNGSTTNTTSSTTTTTTTRWYSLNFFFTLHFLLSSAVVGVIAVIKILSDAHCQVRVRMKKHSCHL